jgi:putative nucleotidyltransferase with HDIG domain
MGAGTCPTSDMNEKADTNISDSTPSRIEEILAKVHSLPPLPAAVEHLLQLTRDTEGDVDEMAAIIASDAALTSRILRVANSSFYSLSQKVSTVSQAVIVLGLHAIKNLALSVAVFGFKSGKQLPSPLDRKDLWRHALGVGSTARMLATRFRLRNWEEAFVGGLLHDIGKIVFLECFHEEYCAILKNAAQGLVPLCVLEQEAFGADHAAVGGELCKRWKIPSTLTHMVSDHHSALFGRPALTEEDEMACMIRVADNLTKMASIGSDGEPTVETDFLNIVGAENISSEQLGQVLLSLPEEIHKVEIFFSLTPAQTFKQKHTTTIYLAQVSLADATEREIVRMTLLAMGYIPVTSENVDMEHAFLAGAVVDDRSLSADVRADLTERKVPILDFTRWRKENDVTGHFSQVNIQRLQAWLKKEMPRSRKKAE